MTIEYKDSKRIVGLSTDMSSNIVTINHRLSSTDDHAYADLGSALSNSSWVMRYKMVISGYSASNSNPNNSYLFALSKTNTAEQNTQSLGFKLQIGGVGGSVAKVSGGTSSQNSGEGYSGADFTTTVANATWYIECIRNGADFSVRITTNSDYTGGENKTWSTSGTVEDLRYIKYTNRDDSSSSWVLVSTISDIKIYDGVTSATGTFVTDGTWTASASEKVTVATQDTKPTDVQNNSILVEKDTARRYWFSEELAPTYETNFASSSGWTENTTTASDIDIDTANNKVYLNLTHNSSETSVLSRTLPTTSNTAWILRFKVNATSVGTDGSLLVGLSTNASASDTQQRFLGFWFKELNSSALRAVTDDNNNAGGLVGGNNTSGYTGTPSSGTDYYVTVVRDVNDIKVTTRTGSHTGTAVGSGTVTTAVDGTATGLNTLKIMNHKSSTGGAWIGYLYDLEFYNGVTSVTPATWTMTPTYQYSSTDWVKGGTGGTIGSSDISLALDTDGSKGQVYYNITGVSSSKFVLDFTLNFSRLTIGSNLFWFMGFTNKYNWMSTNATNHMGIFVQQESGTKVFGCSDGTSTWNGASEDTQTWVPTTGVDYYFRLTKLTSTTYKVELFDNSARTSVTSTSNGTVTSMTDLDHIMFSNDNNGGTGNATFTISDLNFYNGVTTPN